MNATIFDMNPLSWYSFEYGKRVKAQQRRLHEAHLQWMADKINDQTDDILIMGISYV
jgi:hypothetical protein